MIITGKYPNLRLRRNRKQDWIRRLVQENELSVNDLILPIFVMEGKNKTQQVRSMPGVLRYTVDKIPLLLDKAVKNKIPLVAVFPYTDKKLKNNYGSEALNSNNLVCRSIRLIKKKCPVAIDADIRAATPNANPIFSLLRTIILLFFFSNSFAAL